MTIRKWFYLFSTTLIVGIVFGLAAGLSLQLTDQEIPLVGEAFGFNVVNMLLAGATISVLSQMGFFSYLIFRYIFMGIIRSKWILDGLQIIVVIMALIDLFYFRYTGTGSGGSFGSYLTLPVVLIAVSLAVAWWKVKLTNASAWVPTLFFMIAVTALEALPALRIDNPASTVFVLTPLIACNAWQILVLSKVLDSKKEPK